jgi:predicted transcriptional regulator
LPTSTRFVLAIHVLTSLAVTDGNPMRSEDLAFSVNTNATFIRSLLSRLQEAGLTTSQPGVRQCSFFIPSVAIASPDDLGANALQSWSPQSTTTE